MEKNTASSLTLGFYGGAESVTGANFILSDGASMLMVDCGLEQDDTLCGECNRAPFPYIPRDVDALFVTHAHMDHIGRIPQLVREGFSGPIYLTHPTRDLTELSLLDGARIGLLEAQEKNVEPLYTEADVKNALALMKPISYEQEVSVGDFSVLLLPAGHILGSAVVRVRHASRETVVFSGDLGNAPDPLLERAPDIFDATYIVLETVYGNRRHVPHDVRRALFLKKLKKAIDRSGAILIPAFSIARTQLLLYELSTMFERGEVPRIPVFLDSPLAIRVTEVYKTHPEYLADGVEDMIKDMFGFKNLTMTLSREESDALVYEKNPKIIIAGAGMSHGGRIEEHERRYLGDPKTTLLIPGYQAVGTFGRRLLEGEKRVRIQGTWVKVRATIEMVEGYSAHADEDGLLDFVLPSAESRTLKKVFLTMGELGASMHMAQKLHDTTGLATTIPKKGDVVRL